MNASTGYTPFRLTTGREAVFPATLHETTHITRIDVKQFLNDYDATLTAARDRIADAKLTAALNPPQPRKPHSFQPGDQVLLSTEHLSCRNHKFSKPWVGPFPVLAVYGNALELDLSSQPSLRLVSPKWNVASIRRYHAPLRHSPSPARDIPDPVTTHIAPVAAPPTRLPTSLSDLVPSDARPAFASPSAPKADIAQPTTVPAALPRGTDTSRFVTTRRDPTTHELWYRYHAHDTPATDDLWVTAHDARTTPAYVNLYREYNQRCRHERLAQRGLPTATLSALSTTPVARRAILWWAPPISCLFGTTGGDCEDSDLHL